MGTGARQQHPPEVAGTGRGLASGSSRASVAVLEARLRAQGRPRDGEAGPCSHGRPEWSIGRQDGHDTDDGGAAAEACRASRYIPAEDPSDLPWVRVDVSDIHRGV